MKKVFLTGATGLIGKEVIEPLKKAGFDIYVLTLDDNNQDCGINWIKCNLFDTEKIKKTFDEIKPEYLLHFAWIATGDYAFSNVNFDFLKASMNLLKFFKENKGKRAVFAGTCFEYENKNSSIKETDKISPKNTYSKCKNWLHEIAEEYSNNNDISFAWGRIFYVYGKGEDEKRLTAYLLKNLRESKEAIVKNGDLIKDYVYSKDIAGAFVKLLDSDVQGSVNISTGKCIAIKEFASKIAKKLQKTEFLEIRQEQTDQPPMVVGDNHRLINEVGYKFEYSLDKALDEIINDGK